jgi:uncharacterized protein YggE
MRRLVILFLATAAVASAIAFAGVGRPDPARGDSTPTNVVTTNGHGVITAVPDEATVSAGVRTNAASAAEAIAANGRTANAVVGALKRAGGTELQTQEVSLYPQTDQQGTVTGYTAENTVSAKAKIADAGALIDEAVAAGATTVNGPTLDVSDRDALYREALKKAVEDARAKALALADAGGFGLGPVTTVVEQGAASPPVFQPVAAAAKDASSTPVEPGTQDVAADVTVSFTIR